jgi:hypothetical protein
MRERERALLLLYRYGNSTTPTRNEVHFKRIVQKPGYDSKDLESLDDREIDR